MWPRPCDDARVVSLVRVPWICRGGKVLYMGSEMAKTRRSPVRLGISMVALQCVVVGALSVAALAGSRPYGAVSAIVVVLCGAEGIFFVFCPLRATVLDRVLSAVAGAASLCAAWFSVAVRMSDRTRGYPIVVVHGDVMSRYGLWAVAVVALMVLTVVVAFARQMLREERSYLVRSLSHAILGTVACVGAAGWLFLPAFIDLVSSLAWSVVAVSAFLVVVLIIQAVLSLVWWSDSDPDPSARSPWLGTALIPVFVSGYLVFLVVFVMSLM